MDISIALVILTSTPLDFTITWVMLMWSWCHIKCQDTIWTSVLLLMSSWCNVKYFETLVLSFTRVNVSSALVILTTTPIDPTIICVILMSSCCHIKCSDTLVLRLPPYEHQYCLDNTHIYADGPHHYMGNTHVELLSHRMFRHFGAKFQPPNECRY